MKVIVEGVKSGKGVRLAYSLLDYYDRSTGTTAMARTTAYTASVVAQLVAGGFINRGRLSAYPASARECARCRRAVYRYDQVLR